ncbi:MAG: DUF1353 domain-containing protein [Planctomycetota bacterium]|nr:DUF1353 domain-containing protein [Planctomycetota bacterium]
MPFTTEPLRVEQIGDDCWKLLEPIRYQGRDEWFTVPAGYETDFASVPQAFWWIVPRYGRYTKASVLHDHLCEKADAGEFSRCDADGIFRRSMREEQVPRLRRWMMWAAVRWGGKLKGCGVGSALGVIVITILAAPLVGPTAALAAVALLVLYVLEWIAYMLTMPMARKPRPEPAPPPAASDAAPTKAPRAEVVQTGPTRPTVFLRRRSGPESAPSP